MGLTITNKVFLQNKNFKTKRKRKETKKQKGYAKEKQNLYIKKRNVNQLMNFPP